MFIDKLITRRDFLRGTAAAALSISMESGGQESGKSGRKARVILIRDDKVLDGDGKPREKVLKDMIDEALKTLLEREDAVSSWKSLFEPSDIVGIKSNSWAYLPTPLELDTVIKQRLANLGVSEKNIAADDRGVLNNPVFLRSTALINVRPLRTHFWSGIGGCIKNYIMFVPNPSAYHNDACSDLARIWSLPIVRGKTRFNVLSVLQPQFYGRGPHFFDRRFIWPYKGLLLGTDPVALDAVGAHLLQIKRISYFGEDRPLDVMPKHITVADKKFNLGVSDLKRIQLIKLGWLDEVLI